MTTFILAPGEEFIQCPYNRAHQITNARFLTHLEKCRKAYTKDLTTEGRRKCIKICRHNALHHVPKPELRWHEARCVDAIAVVNHLAYHNSDEAKRRYAERRRQDLEKQGHSQSRDSQSSGSSSSSFMDPVPSSSSSCRGHSPDVKPSASSDYGLEEEDWEAESNGYAPGYDPEIKLKNEVIIYNPQGLTKSERKKHRNQIRLKAQGVQIDQGVHIQPAEPFYTTWDVRSNMKDLKITDEDRKPSLRVGEIDHDDDDKDNHHDGPRKGDNVRRGKKNGNTYLPDRNPTTAKPTRKNKDPILCCGFYRESWASKIERAKEKIYYPDSDVYVGKDPYI